MSNSSDEIGIAAVNVMFPYTLAIRIYRNFNLIATSQLLVTAAAFFFA